MNRYFAEVIGTFCLVFAGTGAIVIDQVSGGKVTPLGISLTFGLVVTAMIYAVGDVSGAHLNPAVTLGFWFARQFPARSILPYILCQFMGAVAASIVLRLMFGPGNLGATQPAGSDMQSFVLETILTAMLMFVILGVASGPKEKGLLAGIAIGGVIAFEAIFAGPISGASMNPIRSLAPALVSGTTGHLWLYLVAPVLGSGIGVLCKRVMS